MKSRKIVTVAVLAGDGIGQEIMPPCIQLLKQVLATSSIALEFNAVQAGAEYFLRHGEAISEQAFASCIEADAILLGAMGLPNIRHSDGTEIAPQLELRERLGLYAGVRPIRAVQGLGVQILKDERAQTIDFVLVRESVEGLFSERTKLQQGVDRATDTLLVTRDGARRVSHFALRLAAKRKGQGYAGHVTCIDKANVLGSLAFFRKVFLECAEAYPKVGFDAMYVDAAAQALVMAPWQFDVLVTENMFGDILSELGAGLIGGVGFAPSADIGDCHAVFQPCHGSAPDIAGREVANPAAMFLSGAMMLEWLAQKYDSAELSSAGRRLQEAVYAVFESGELLPVELGGRAGTQDIFLAVMRRLA